MHFDFTISVTQVTLLLMLGVALWRANQVLTLFHVEHEMLMEDYCERKDLLIDKLPTRQKRPSFFKP